MRCLAGLSSVIAGPHSTRWRSGWRPCVRRAQRARRRACCWPTRGREVPGGPAAARAVLYPSGKRPHPCACGYRVRVVAALRRHSRPPAPAARARCRSIAVLRAAPPFHRCGADHRVFCSAPGQRTMYMRNGTPCPEATRLCPIERPDCRCGAPSCRCRAAWLQPRTPQSALQAAPSC